MLRSCIVVLGLLILCWAGMGHTVLAATLWFEAEDFEITGSWMVYTHKDTFGGRILQGLTEPGSTIQDAFTYVHIPEAALWHLWVRSRDFATNQGSRYFSVGIEQMPSEKLFGRHGKDGWAWEYGGSFFLPKGESLIRIHDASCYYARIDSLVLTTEPDFVPPNDPRDPLASVYRQKPRSSFLHAKAPSMASLIHGPVNSESLYTMENSEVKLDFRECTDGTRNWIHTDLWINCAGTWQDASLDPLHQGYLVLYSSEGTLNRGSDYFPYWNVVSEVVVGGEKTRIQSWTQDAFSAGTKHWVFCEKMEVISPKTVRLTGRRPGFVFEADWHLEANAKYPSLTMRIRPEKDGYYSMAFTGFFESPVDDVDFLLLPFMWQSKRLPKEPLLNVEAYAPTPIALVQRIQDGKTLTYGLAPTSDELHFRWPRFENSRFGLTIQGPEGGVQPGLFAPILGSEASCMEAGDSYEFCLRVLVQEGPWFSTYRTVVTEEYGLSDYRSNWQYSLNDAVFNMIDLMMDDHFGGWNTVGKGPLNIEMKSTVTHASPATAVSLYRLTGSEELFEKRALPSIEFMISRRIPHFTYNPEDADNEIYTTLGGPNTWYGASTYYALWELTNRLTPVLWKYMWAQEGMVRNRPNDLAVPLFGEELTGYQATQDPSLLNATVASAKSYFKNRVTAPQIEEMGLEPFFNYMFLPHWVNYIDLYSLCQEGFVLEGAKEGANWQLTGIWTQPPVVNEQVQVTLDDVLRFGVRRVWWYGDQQFRLGFPLQPKNILTELVPAWLVSPVGLGFEQPVTYMSSDSCVLMSNWAADLVRLTEMTGDSIYRTFARNAILGRFANYPGYYVNHFSTIYMQPDFPYVGPDTTSVYYHHILPQLAYTIDFLMAEAQYRSGGQIAFPWVRQQGYVWFSSRLYGHQPGRFFHYEQVWPWLNKDVLKLDNPAINYITAHSNDDFFAYLMSESDTQEVVEVSWDRDLLRMNEDMVDVSICSAGQWNRQTVNGNTIKLTLASKQEVALVVHGTDVQVDAHAFSQRDAEPTDSYLVMPTYDYIAKEIYAAVIQARSDHYYAYIYTNSNPGLIDEIKLHYYTTDENSKQSIERRAFPFEFTVKVTESEEFWFQLEFVDKLGRTKTSPWLHLKGKLK